MHFWYKWSSKTSNTWRWVMCLCMCVCLCVCVLVGGCVVSLVGLRVCVLVSSGKAKYTFSCLRTIHIKQRLGKQLIHLFNRGDGNSWRILYVFPSAGRNSYVPLQRMFIRLLCTLSKTTVFSGIYSIYLLKWKEYESIPLYLALHWATHIFKKFELNSCRGIPVWTVVFCW